MKTKKSDAIVALFVVAVAALFIVSIPPFALDLLIVANLATSILLLLVVLFSNDAGRLFTFPVLLLLSTLFRLGLNVASSRSILLNGYAGEVIQAFGQFLVRGEVIVGVVIFSIITIVNYIVVARGATRVAEVAARFTLDSLPVKQMAIESDVRSGLLTNQEAVIRREELRRESQLYGSMDGAMKFVQGDVIAGLVIIFTNIIGGLTLGLQSGMSFEDAVQTYTNLTVGDGLVSQIPSLLTAVCSGIIVTRVASGAQSTLGSELAQQIMGRKEAWLFSGLIMLLLAVVPGPPFVPFAIGGVTFIVLAYAGPRFSLAEANAAAGADSGSSFALEQLPWHGSREQLASGTSRETFEIKVDESFFVQTLGREALNPKLIWGKLRDLHLKERGVRLPNIRIVPSRSVLSGEYIFYKNSVEIYRGRLPSDAIFVDLNPQAASLFGINVVASDLHPIFDTAASWAVSEYKTTDILDAGSIPYLNQLEFVLVKVVKYFLENPEEVLSMSDVYSMIKSLTAQHPGLVSNVVDSGLVTVPRLTQILQNLMEEGVSIGDVRAVLEHLAAYYARFDHPTDAAFISDDILTSLKERRIGEIVENYISCRGGIRVVVLDPNLVKELGDVLLRMQGDMPTFERAFCQKISARHREILDVIRTKGILPIAILCETDLKVVVKALLKACGQQQAVLAFSDVSSRFAVEEIGLLGA